ncbi:MAG: FAD-dependent oxidoreductase, partial [Actinocrinis sp.]
RGLQLRQEKMFALSSPLAVTGRRSLYRLVDRSPALKRRVLAGAYFQLQERGAKRAAAAIREAAPSAAKV